MNTYYSKKGKVWGRAWSTMTCWMGSSKDIERHKPHTHDPMYAMYGPYMCPGWPMKRLYQTPPRKAVGQ